MKCKIIINPGNVVKLGNPDLMKIEVEKTRRGGVIGRESGLFRVPRVIDFDSSRGIAIFEKIENLIPIKNQYAFNADYRIAAERLGEALAVIHRELSLPDDMTIPLPPCLAWSGDEVFLHGDFSVFNICREESGEMVIIDWQMTGVHGGRATRGTPCFDLVWFINNLFFRPTLQHFCAESLIMVAWSFLKGYYSISSGRPSITTLAEYAERFFSFKRPMRRANATWRERPILFLSHRLARIFIHKLRYKRIPF